MERSGTANITKLPLAVICQVVWIYITEDDMVKLQTLCQINGHNQCAP